MTTVHSKIPKIQILLNAMRFSRKRRNVFESFCRDMNGKEELPNLDCKTRWSSVILIIKNAFRCRLVLNSVTSRVDDLRPLEIAGTDYRGSENNLQFYWRPLLS